MWRAWGVTVVCLNPTVAREFPLETGALAKFGESRIGIVDLSELLTDGVDSIRQIRPENGQTESIRLAFQRRLCFVGR